MPTNTITSFPDLADYIRDYPHFAASSLRAYFFKDAFTGSQFEWLRSTDSNSITADDIVAVSMLSVNVPPRASMWILGPGQSLISLTLKTISESHGLEHPNIDIRAGGQMWKLWRTLFELEGIGETICSKILAAKRPLLFPIFDQHVGRALNLKPTSYWESWRNFLRTADGRYTVLTLNTIAAEIGLTNISALRLIDIVVWMQAHGYKFITRDQVEAGRMIAVNYVDPLS